MNRWCPLWRRLKLETSSGPFNRFSWHWITWNECSGIVKLRWDEWTKSGSRSTALLCARFFPEISLNWMARGEVCDAAVVSLSSEFFRDSSLDTQQLKTQ